jgi:hypothetical protein
MRKSTLALSLSLSLSLAGAALAKGGSPQNHHCMKEGSELAGKTKKECKKEGGKWEKMSTGGADKASAKAPAPAPAKSDAK